MAHIDLDLALMVIEGELPPRVLLDVLLEHLKQLCPECRSTFEILDHGRPPVLAASSTPSAPVDDYARAFSRASVEAVGRAQRLKKELAQATRDLKELLGMRREDRRQRVVNARTRFRSRALAEKLVEQSRQVVRADPGEALDLAELANVVLLWTPGAIGEPWAETVRLRACAYRANALRVSGDLVAADAGFAELRRALGSAPTNDAELLAEIASLEASLRTDQRRFDDADQILCRAVLLFRSAGDQIGVARALVQRGITQRYLADLEGARESLRESLELIDPRTEAHLFSCAIGNLALCLCEAESYQEASTLIERHGPWLTRQDDEWTRLHLAALEGRIALGLRDLPRAEKLFRATRDGYLAQGRGLDAALASLDLAMVYHEQGRTAELKQLARQMQPIFESRDVHREAVAALILFQRAVAAEQVTVQAIRKLRGYLESARSQPASGIEQAS